MNEFYRGDTKRIRLVISRNSIPIDITGATILFSMKQKMSDTVLALQKTGVLSNPLTGEAIITLDSADTLNLLGKYYYDIQITSSTGEVSTLICETVNILQDISQ